MFVIISLLKKNKKYIFNFIDTFSNLFILKSKIVNILFQNI